METLVLQFVWASAISLLLTIPVGRISQRWQQITLVKKEKVELADKNIYAINLGIKTLLIGGFISVVLFLLDSPFGLVFLLATFALYFSFHFVFWLETGVEIINPRFLLAIILGLWGTTLSTIIVVIFV